MAGLQPVGSTAVVGSRRDTQLLLESISTLREASGEDVALERRQTKRSKAMAHFIVYWVFLLFIFAAVFAPPYTTHFYRQTATVKEPLLQNEIYPNVFFENAMNADQMYEVLKQLLLPHTFANKYYSGKVFSPNDKQYKYRAQYTSEALLALGRIRLRTLRVGEDVQALSLIHISEPTRPY